MAKAFKCDGCDKLLEGIPAAHIYSHLIYVKTRYTGTDYPVTITTSANGEFCDACRRELWIAAMSDMASIDLTEPPGEIPTRGDAE